MEIDDEALFRKPTTPGLNLSNFAKSGQTETQIRMGDKIITSNVGRSFSQMNTPVRSHSRRSSSGLFYNNMFGMCGYFRHLKKLHMESLEGLNVIKQPPARAVFRSSLPATPIATPIYRESFPLFTEQSLMERLCRTPSPRRAMCSRSSSRMETDERDVQPMDISSPTIDEEDPNSSSSPNKDPSMSDLNSNIDHSIYYRSINDQFSPD